MTTDRSALRVQLCSSVLICGSISLLFFDRLGGRDLWGSHEARAAQDAQRMLDDGDWALPRLFDGATELQKPPMYYWCVAAISRLRGGVDAVAVRLPSALAALGTVVLVFAYLAHRGRPRAGLVAAIALATAQHFTWIGRTGRIDVPLTFTTAVAVLCLRQPAARRVAFVGYVAVAAGVLLKGPLGAILPGVVLVAPRLLRFATLRRSVPAPERFGEASRSEELRVRATWVWGLPLVAALTLPWFVYAHRATDGEFTRVFFWYHHVQRATGGADALASHPWWFYLVRLAVDWQPWALPLGVALWQFGRRPELRSDRDARFGLVWLVSVAVLLSLSRFKRADYLLPAYPGAAILLGCWAERFPARVVRRVAFGSLAACAVGWAVFARTVVPELDADREKQTFAATIRSFAPRPGQVLLFRVEDHLLSFHLGRPLNSFLEWENLDVWAGRPGPHYVVMPAACEAVWRSYITSGGLDELARWTDRTDRRRPRDLVLVRTRPHDPRRHDADRDRSPETLSRPVEPTVAGP